LEEKENYNNTREGREKMQKDPMQFYFTFYIDETKRWRRRWEWKKTLDA
jgi:hypothetical protein